MSQSITLPALGLMTDPGPFTAAPAGGMVEAQNVVVLRPGVMEPRPGSFWFKDSTLKAGDDDASAVYADPNTNVFVWATTPWIIRKNGTTTITGPTTFISGRIRVAQTGGRALFTSEQGVCTLPGQLASPAVVNNIAYRAGMPQPYAPAFAVSAAPTGYPAGAAWLPNGESVAYRVTLRRRLADGTIVESAPSCRCVVTNGAGAARGITMDGSTGSGVYAAWLNGDEGYDRFIIGDELCIYRSARIAGTPSDEMRLRAVLTYDSSVNGFTMFVDGAATAWFDGLDDSAWNGPALYTNSTQEGALLGNYRPEYARDIALYSGMTFYAGAKSAQRVDAVLKKVGTTFTVDDPSQAMCTFPFTCDTTAGSPVVVVASNIRFFSVGQVVTTNLQAPGTASATFPADAVVQSINVAGSTITMSANASATAFAVSGIGWDWFESSVAGTRIYCNSGVGTLPARYFALTAESIDDRWNGDAVTTIQLRCSGVTQSTEIACSWFQPSCTDASFSIRSTKPLAWDVWIDRSVGVASRQFGNDATLQWSKTNEPEHCPLPYRTVIGDAAYAIRRIVAARQSLLIFKDDGLYQIFGSDPQALSIELVDRTIVIPAAKDQTAGDEPSKWVGRFDDRIYAMTTRGPMAITDAGAELVGAPILETLRRRFQYAYGAFDESRRALMVDPQTRRVGFFLDTDGTETTTTAYILDVDTGTWTTWTYPRTIADFSMLDAFGAPIFAGGYSYGYILENRTMIDDATVTAAEASLPSSRDSWPSESCTVSSVTGTGPYTVTIAAGSEWTPRVGDLIVQSNVGHIVTGITSATVFTTATAPSVAAATWYEGFECRCVWNARDEGNVGAEKHWDTMHLPFEFSVLLSRYSTPTSALGLLKSYFKGYRNTSAAIEQYVDGTQEIGAAPYPIEPAWKPVPVPTAFARDWALKVGFSIRQAGVWFATAGISILVGTAQPGKVSR